MKRYSSYFVFLLTFILSTACQEDFLDRPPEGQLTDAFFPQTASDALLATNGAYNILRDWRFNSGGFPMFDIMSDDALKGSNPGDGAPIAQFNNFTYDASSDNILGYYTTLYEAIRKANFVINEIPAIQMDQGLQQRLIAEARYIRALSYFRLTNAFGDVILVTNNDDVGLNFTRNPESEIREFINQDLMFAIENLPERSEYPAEELGRATKGSARALLAKNFLYMENYEMAAQYALEVINSGQYELDPDFSRVFNEAGEFGPGSIFEIGALPFPNQDQGGNQYANTQGVRGTPNRGWGFNRPSVDLIRFYQGREDPRNDPTIIYVGEELDGIRIVGDPTTPDTTMVNGEVTEIETYNQKVWVPGVTSQEQWEHNVRVIRYADVLLIAAEALARLGRTEEALTYLNRVRERARGGNEEVLPPVTTTNQEELIDIILAERRAELAMEGERFFDLVRTGRAAEVLGPLGYQEGKHDMLPIPQNEIDLSGGELQQTEGWR
jgi:tetratricopeptide (TPR) repeat protein